MTIKEKLEIIKGAATEASEKIYEAKEILQSAEDETGYKYGYRIMQELEDGYMSGLRKELEDIANGENDEDIAHELGGDEEEE